MRTAAALLLAGLLAGCASLDVESFDTRQNRSATSADAVVLFDGEASVDRPFRRIGALHWYGKNVDAGEVDAALREEAAGIGADGVIKVDDQATAGGPFFWPLAYVSGFAEAIAFEADDQ